MAIKKEIYIIILVSFLLFVFLILIFVYPLLKGIQQDSQQIISQKNDIFLLQNEFNEAQNFQMKYETYKPDLDKLDQMFIDSQNPVDFIEFIEKTALDSGVKTGISTPSFSQDGSLNFVDLQITCSGDFSKVLKFINALETGNYLIQVQNLDAVKTQATFLIKIFAK